MLGWNFKLRTPASISSRVSRTPRLPLYGSTLPSGIRTSVTAGGGEDLRRHRVLRLVLVALGLHVHVDRDQGL
jgi:hypothetical protein